MNLEYDHKKEQTGDLFKDSDVSSSAEMVLEDLVNIRILNDIVEKFTQVTGVRCVIINTNGKPITDMKMSISYCQLIRSDPIGRSRCEECDRTRSLEAKRKGEAIFYTCHAGLIDAAQPIVVNNQYMGSFLCGQVFLLGNIIDYDDNKFRIKDLNIDESLAIGYLSEVQIISKEKLITALEMLTITTSYIAEIGIANITQRQLMTEMKSKAKLEELLRETERIALESQINPHFLFNCLNTIGRVALTEGAYQTQDLIYAISDILRSLLKNSQSIISIKEEIKYVRDYLAIQLTRFGDRIRVNFDIDEDVLEAKIPKFTIQPLVENAILHGLEPQIDGGILTIKAVKEDNNVIITISDTGVGILEAKMEDLLKFKQEANLLSNVTGIGISNVHQRIQYYFGQKYGLKIDSKPGEGCRVTVTVKFAKA